MTVVLTLVGDDLSPPSLDAVRRATGGAAPRWLAPGLACDIDCPGDDAKDVETGARDALGTRPVDLIAQAAVGRRKKLLLSDMDSTIIAVECIDELADFVGKKREIAAITEAAMRGELVFEQALERRLEILRDVTEDVLRRAYDERVRLMPGARTLVMTMRAHGAFTALVSGGFSYFTARVREAAGFDIDRANRLIFENGRLAGVAKPILGAETKLAMLEELRLARGLARADTLAVGDGANDIPMIEAAGLGVAFRAKPKTQEAARARIDHGDLTALLYFQGYARDEFEG